MVHIWTICTIFFFFCANVYNICYFFVCIQCKLTLQVESKDPLKEKKRKKNYIKKLKPIGELEEIKKIKIKRERGNSLNQKYCS